MLDAAYALITFSLGMTVASVVVLIGSGIVNVAGMSFYPLIYNSYRSIRNQIPANETEVQQMLYDSYRSSLNNINQVSNYTSIALSTFATVLQIIGFIGAFIILLGLLMNLAFAPRQAYIQGGV